MIAHEKCASLKSIVIHVSYTLPLTTQVRVGEILSIRVTVAVAFPVFPIKSINVNTNDPFPVKRYHVAFNHVIGSEKPVIVA